MISLIIKDLKANQSPVLSFMLGNLVFAGIVYYFWKFDVFVLHGTGIIAFSITSLSAHERLNNKEMLWCSMPVKRKQIVISRYLSSLVIVIVGLIFWFLAAVIFNMIFSNAASDFKQITYVNNFWMPVILIAVFISLLLPVIFRIKSYAAHYISALVTFITAVTMGIAVQRSFHSDKSYFFDLVSRTGFFSLAVLAVAAILVLTGLSVLVSIWFYNKRNL